VIAAVAASVALATSAPHAQPKLCGTSMMQLVRRQVGLQPGLGRIERWAARDNYALAVFIAGEGAGEAIFHRESGRWCVLEARGGGMMSREHLESFGVPRATAARLDGAVNGSHAQR
jgi:hypothetical protein